MRLILLRLLRCLPPFRLFALLLAAGIAWPAFARCVGEDRAQPQPEPPAATAQASRDALRKLVHEALARSDAVGAARLLAEAAVADVEEARAGAAPQAALTAGGAWVGNRGDNVIDRTGSQARAGLTLGAPLYDAGRVAELSAWRARLAEAARFGELTAREQVALQTVSIAIEHARYGAQVRVYAAYAAQMSCLVGSLERIVAADRGRASELVQARKTQLQAELSGVQAQSQRRQAEIRLRRFVGDAPLPESDVAAALQDPPPVDATLAEAERASEIAQLAAQADAQDRYARAVEAANKPQVNWAVGGTRSAGAGSQTSWSAGLSLTVPLLDARAEPARNAALRRAEAARAQRADALAARRSRISDVHDQAVAALDRARRTDAVLRESERVREATFAQWQQLGRRSLFDVMSAEGEHVGLSVARVDALHEARQATALLWSLGLGVPARLEAGSP